MDNDKSKESFIKGMIKQMEMNKEEVIDEYQLQKQHMSEWIENMEGEMNTLKDISHEKMEQFTHQLEELKTTLKTKATSSKENLLKHQEEVKHKIEGLIDLSEEMKEKVEETTKESLESIGENLALYKTKVDFFMIQMHLKADHAQKEYEDLKVEFNGKLNELKDTYSNAAETTQERWSNFSSEMSQAVDHVKKAFIAK